MTPEGRQAMNVQWVLVQLTVKLGASIKGDGMSIAPPLLFCRPVIAIHYWLIALAPSEVNGHQFFNLPAQPIRDEK